MPKQALLDFIKEARARGFDDYQIREPLLKKGWPAEEVEEAFFILKSQLKKTQLKYKTKLEIYVDNKVLASIEKRAKKNLFSLNEQVEDILRRSCVNLNKASSSVDEKLDDKFIALFSRRKRTKC
jgi:hypothetical protein